MSKNRSVAINIGIDEKDRKKVADALICQECDQ